MMSQVDNKYVSFVDVYKVKYKEIASIFAMSSLWSDDETMINVCETTIYTISLHLDFFLLGL